jgi:hypothetical protein
VGFASDPSCTVSDVHPNHLHPSQTDNLRAIGISTIAILTRCAFRCAELSGGFDGKLANDEVAFMLLDGLLMVITVILLTVAHPGITLGDRWKVGAFWTKNDRGTYALTSKVGGSADSLMTQQQQQYT